ncbi:MAG: redoxin domain-containing protein [Microcoleus vaginatus WJT46-NPBG5]|jgi:peroxiredoxin/predicted 2-oxoglutarate/Fe(II)-dependent dioxygenase YbiX|nr:redoxin domain-containing protein [Microcoleus vaginatus WJT46-NPBG5]
MIDSTRTLTVGDHAPLYALENQDKSLVILRDGVGKPSLLIFYANDDIPGCRDIACAFRDVMPTFNKLDVQIFGISSNPPQSRQAFAKQHNISYPLLFDLNNLVSQQYGVCYPGDANDSSILTYNRIAFLLDINLRVVKIYPLIDLQSAMGEILKDIKTVFPREEPRHLTMQAPVLLIPNVLDRNLCRELMYIWETEGNEESGSMRRQGEKTITVLNYNHKIRRDHFIKHSERQTILDRILKRRVFPEISKAFNFEVTRREDYRIACYDASRGGFFRPHRDNTTGGTAHRRFAMTLNLNADEYEGGYLRFPEYGPHLYKPETGSAVIFSCTLMHEATDVIAGRRFVLLSFFYGEKEAQQREAYEKQNLTDYNNLVILN